MSPRDAQWAHLLLMAVLVAFLLGALAEHLVVL